MAQVVEKLWLKSYPDGVRPYLEYPEMSMPDFLDRAAGKMPDRTAIIFAGLELSYQMVSGMVDRSATALHNLGVRKGDRVALMTPNCPQYIVAFFAIQKTMSSI